jgi:hypothetical protein
MCISRRISTTPLGVQEGVICRMLRLRYQYIAQSKEPSMFIILDLHIPSILRRTREINVVRHLSSGSVYGKSVTVNSLFKTLCNTFSLGSLKREASFAWKSIWVGHTNIKVDVLKRKKDTVLHINPMRLAYDLSLQFVLRMSTIHYLWHLAIILQLLRVALCQFYSTYPVCSENNLYFCGVNSGTDIYIYRVSQEECARLRESVP